MLDLARPCSLLVILASVLAACGDGAPISQPVDAASADLSLDLSPQPMDAHPDRTTPDVPDASRPEVTVSDGSSPDGSSPDVPSPDGPRGDVAAEGPGGDSGPTGELGAPATDSGSSEAGSDVAMDSGPVCPAGQTVCSSVCRDLTRDGENCGACGALCAAGQVCSAGACRVSCATGQSPCEGVCRDLGTDRAHCGTCSRACLPGEICTLGVCALSCPSAQSPCAGACRFLQSDAAHCGACGRGCSAANAVSSCVDGACALASCSVGFGDCDGSLANGCETDTRVAAAHCGACGRSCTAGQICSLGLCRTPVPRNCNELHRSDPSATSGNAVIDPDGPGGLSPFPVYCDMALDAGGWTLLGAGSWWQNNADVVASPGGSNSLLVDARRNAIIATSSNLYRNGSTATTRQFIEDLGADFGPATATGGRHYWRTRAGSLRCATAYSAVTGGTMALTTTREMTCDPTGVGSHTCGVTSGWILFHDLDTYNISNRHPCAFGNSGTPTGRALGDLWVR